MSKYKKDSWIDPRVETRNSQIEGKGLFAKLPITKRDIVFIWGGGRVVRDDELREIEQQGKYHSSIAIGENKNLLFNAIDPKSPQTRSDKQGSGVGGLNHSCDPNLWMQDEVTVVARRDVPQGEELTIDYALFTANPQWKLEGCNCDSKFCRHTITGNDWKLPELQEKYKNHFSPYINQRIQKLNLI